MATTPKKRAPKPLTKPKKGRRKRVAALSMHMRQPLPMDALKLRVDARLSKTISKSEKVAAGSTDSRSESDSHVRLLTLKSRGKKATSPGYYIVVIFDGSSFLSVVGGATPVALADSCAAIKIGKKLYRLQTAGDYLFADRSQSEVDRGERRVAASLDVDDLRVPVLSGTRPSIADVVNMASDSVMAGSLMALSKNRTSNIKMPPTPRRENGQQVTDRQVNAIIRVLPGQSFSALRQMWLNALKHVHTQSTASQASPLSRLLNSIESEWDRRSEISIQSLDDKFFQWPSTDAPAAKRNLGDFEAPGQGMLSYLEYHVGRTNGQPTKVRRAILDRVFAGKLPKVFEPSYMLQWGEPTTSKRLQKMAESIAAFVRNFKRREDDRLELAIREWEADLRFLFDEYYVGKFRFAWPTIRTN